MNMTKPTKTIFSTIAVCIVIAFVNVASVNASEKDITLDTPREHRGHKHQGHKNDMKRMTKVLSLSEDQQAQIKEIKSQAKEQHQELHASMKAFKIAERKLLLTKNFDEQGFSALHNSNQSNFEQLALIRAKSKHAVFNVLTIEQQDKWLKIMEHKKGHGKKGRG